MNLPLLEGGIRLVTLVGAILAIGGSMAQGWLPAVRPVAARLRRAAIAGCLLLALGCLLQFGHIAWSLSGGNLDMARAMLPALAGSATGRLVSGRLLLAVVLWLRQVRRRPIGAVEAAFWGVLLAAGLAADSHAADFKGSLFAIALAVDAMHAFLAASWLGGLLMVLWLCREVSDATGLIRQFSRLAGFAMPGAVVAGLANAFLHLPPSGALGLVTFPWGQLLLLKTLLVLGVLGMAAGLRRRTGLLEGECQPVPPAMRRGILAEAILGLVVLGMTGLLSQTNPMPPVGVVAHGTMLELAPGSSSDLPLSPSKDGTARMPM